MSAKGIGEERGKPNSVFHRYKQAADGDSRIGMLKCAECLIASIGCGKAIAAAIVYYKELIDRWNDPVALLRFGQLLINGTGVRKDSTAGVQLVQRSKDAGNAKSTALLDGKPHTASRKR
jgi:TPR repeat protein